jgi:hypothetical protein
MHRRRLLIAALAAATLAAAPLRAGSPEIYAPGGLAINGIDPVGYFTESRPVPGDERYALMWMGATWIFASAASRARFEADPHRYAPAFGGYCAYAVSRGYTASTDPEAWTVVDGTLYLNYSPQVRSLWAADRDANIARARANWPEVLK